MRRICKHDPFGFEEHALHLGAAESEPSAQAAIPKNHTMAWYAASIVPRLRVSPQGKTYVPR